MADQDVLTYFSVDLQDRVPNPKSEQRYISALAKLWLELTRPY